MTETGREKEDGAPQCSWRAPALLDRHPLQQYVSLPPSIYLLLSTHRFPFIFALVFTSSHFTQHPHLFHLMGCLFMLQPELHAHREHFAFSQDFQLVCITVAVHKKMVSPPPPTPPFPCSGNNSCLLLWGFLPASRHRIRGKSPESVSHAYNLEVELYVPSYRGHKLSDVEFLICSLLWSSYCAVDTV